MQYWLIKGSDKNDWKNNLHVGKLWEWHTEFDQKWTKGDRVFVWWFDSNLTQRLPSRLIGLAELEVPFSGRNKKGEFLFVIRPVAPKLGYSPLISELKDVAGLRDARFMGKNSRGTVHPVSDGEAKLLLTEIRKRNPQIADVWSSDAPIAVHELSVEDGESISDVDYIESAAEGRLILEAHLRRERSRDLVKAKKQKYLEDHGNLACEVCGLDFEDVYGARGKGFCEVHHIVPMAQKEQGSITTLNDLAVVCSNCHRVLHRNDTITMEGLKKLVLERRKAQIKKGAKGSKRRH